MPSLLNTQPLKRPLIDGNNPVAGLHQAALFGRTIRLNIANNRIGNNVLQVAAVVVVGQNQAGALEREAECGVLVGFENELNRFRMAHLIRAERSTARVDWTCSKKQKGRYLELLVFWLWLSCVKSSNNSHIQIWSFDFCGFSSGHFGLVIFKQTQILDWGLSNLKKLILKTFV